MKKFVKLFTALAAAACLFASCSDSFNVKANTDKAYIKIVSENYARTIMPENLNKEDLMYELWGKSKEAKIYEKLGSWVSYTKMMASPAIEINVATWEFTLKAFKDNTQILEDTIEKEITFGSNSLSFELEEVVGYGDIEYSFYFVKQVNTTPHIYTTLYEENGTTVVSGESNKEATITDVEEDYDGTTYSSIKFEKENIKNGFYILTIGINAGAEEIETYTTTIKVSTGCKSTGTEIMYNTNGFKYVKPTLSKSGSVLSWDSISKADEYVVYYGTSSGKQETELERTTETSCEISNPSSGYYSIKAVSGGIYSKASNAVYLIAAPVVSVNYKTLSWSAVTGASSYKIYRGATISMGSFYTVDTVTTTSYTITSPSADYYYAVVAVSSDGTVSKCSNVFKCTKENRSWTRYKNTNNTYYWYENYAATSEATYWAANNIGKASSTAETTWKITLPESTSSFFLYNLKSESNCDKLTIKLNGTTIINGVSGEYNSTSQSISLKAGENTLVATYTKDGTQDANNEVASIKLFHETVYSFVAQ